MVHWQHSKGEPGYLPVDKTEVLAGTLLPAPLKLPPTLIEGPNPPFQAPEYVPEIARIRRPAVQSRGFKKKGFT